MDRDKLMGWLESQQWWDKLPYKKDIEVLRAIIKSGRKANRILDRKAQEAREEAKYWRAHSWINGAHRCPHCDGELKSPSLM